jgi:hypothetical protein
MGCLIVRSWQFRSVFRDDNNLSVRKNCHSARERVQATRQAIASLTDAVELVPLAEFLAELQGGRKQVRGGFTRLAIGVLLFGQYREVDLVLNGRLLGLHDSADARHRNASPEVAAARDNVDDDG